MLALILVFVGAKLLVADFLKIPSLVSLAIVVSILGLAVGISLLRPARRMEDRKRGDPGKGMGVS